MSGYWSALARATGERPGDAEPRATPRGAQPFEGLRGPDEDGFVEVDPEPTGLAAPAPALGPTGILPEAPAPAAVPSATTPGVPQSSPGGGIPPAVAAPESAITVAASERSDREFSIVSAPSSPIAPRDPPPAVALDPSPHSPDVPARPVAADRPPAAVAPDLDIAPPVSATPGPAAAPVVSATATPSNPDPTDAVLALPSVVVAAMTEQIAQSVAAIEPAAPPPIVITIDQLDIRIGQERPAPGPARHERPAPVVPLDRFLRRTGDAS